MPRPLRAAAGGFVYHVLNRGNARRTIFQDEGDYRAFERILAEVQERMPMRILAWCLMPNHWHLVLWPDRDGTLSDFMRLVALTHTQRWHAHRTSAGTGHLYQGRFKSFVVQQDAHFLSVCRYVERNALSAGLVQRAENWRWSSLARLHGGGFDASPRIDPWPIPRPSDWIEQVNQQTTFKDIDALQSCLQRGTPYGAPQWVKSAARLLGLESTLHPRGRPKKAEKEQEKGPDPFFNLIDIKPF